MKYRPEIDGLRAVAVIAVLIFHINPEYLPGGFVGVDIFFVISGFLIMSIVKKQVEDESFSYKDFYTKRIKRLMPLFFAVVTFCIIAGYFILLPDPFKKFAEDTLASNIFLANVKSAISGNYFESDSLRPILHFWSLAVEEQFYFIMPALFIFINRYFKKYLIYIFITLLIGSLVLAEFLSSNVRFSQYSYFLLPTRAWELLSGCLLAFLSFNFDRTKSFFFSILGITLIIISVFIINEQSVFPGFITILPVAGAIFLIISGQNGFGKIMSSKPFVSLGLASYSIYMILPICWTTFY